MQRTTRRIIVVGCQGSGKSSLALKLGRKLGLPVVHLDVLYWRPGWQASDTVGFRARVADAIAGERWINGVRSSTVTRSGPTCPKDAETARLELMREAWRSNIERRPVIEAERLKYGATIRAMRLSRDREIDHFLAACSPESLLSTQSTD